MLRIGLTGGIGSGKSTVAGIFEVLGIPVYNADNAARRLMNNDPSIRQKIIKVFGKDSYTGTEINRSFLSSEVLNDERKLQRLNSIVHPVVVEDANQWIKNQNAPYVLKEAAILFESGNNKLVDYVIGVSAPEELRIQRIMKRDNKSPGLIKLFMSRQMDEKKKMSLCDFVIYNDNTQMLIPQVLQVHKKLLALAGSGREAS